jgi:hypothetical protein
MLIALIPLSARRVQAIKKISFVTPCGIKGLCRGKMIAINHALDPPFHSIIQMKEAPQGF